MGSHVKYNIYQLWTFYKVNMLYMDLLGLYWPKTKSMDLLGLYVILCDKVCQWLATDQQFSPDTMVSCTNKTDYHDIAEILLKVVLNTINQPTNYKLVAEKKFTTSLNCFNEGYSFRKGEYTNSTFKDIILLASPDFLFNKKKKKGI